MCADRGFEPRAPLNKQLSRPGIASLHSAVAIYETLQGSARSNILIQLLLTDNGILVVCAIITERASGIHKVSRIQPGSDFGTSRVALHQRTLTLVEIRYAISALPFNTSLSVLTFRVTRDPLSTTTCKDYPPLSVNYKQRKSLRIVLCCGT